MSKEKYCPLHDKHCSERCAWYDEVNQRCEIANISVMLDTIADKLDGIDETLYRPEGAAHE